MNRRTRTSAPSGAGLSSLRHALISFSVIWPLLSSGAEFDSSEWIEASVWPYVFTAEMSGDHASLVVVEQVGIDVLVEQVDGSVSNTPLGRMGPEFILVPAGARVELSLEPRHSAAGRGQFRFAFVALEDPALERAGEILFDAGKRFGSDSEASRIQACEHYGQVSDIAGLESDWVSLARLLTVGCYFATGQEVSEALLSSVREDLSILSVLPYHANWLRGEMLYVSLLYDSADQELDAALTKAEEALVNYPELGLGIRHDIAEIQAVVGGNSALLAFIAGDDDASGRLSERQRLLERSKRHLNEAIAAAEELGNAYILGRAFDFRAGMNFVEQDNLEVMNDLLQAREYIERTGNPDWLLPILGSIGDFHKRWGELRAAQQAYLESLGIIDGNTSNGKYADTYHNIGLFYYDLGDFDRAKSFFEISTRLSRDTGRAARAYTNSRQLALVLEQNGDLVAAKELNANLLDHFARLDDNSNAEFWSPYRIMTQAALARIEHALGNHQQAVDLIAEVISQLESRTINVSIDLSSIYVSYGDILFDSGNREAALEILDRAIGEHLEQPIEMIDLLAAKMRLLQRMGLTESAIGLADQVFDIIESQRMEFDTVRLGPYWSGRTNDIYTAHIEHLLRQADGDVQYRIRAFTVAERARATSLRLRRREILLSRNETNDEARAQWIRIVSEIQASGGKLETEQDQVEFERRISQARERYFASHGISARTESLQIQSLRDIQDGISGDTVLLQFVAGPESLWRYDIRADNWSVTEIGDKSRVEALVASARRGLSQPNFRALEHTIALSDVLLGGLSLSRTDRELLISPSSSLNAVPFSALLLDGRYLSDLVPVTIVPSFSGYFAGTNEIDEQLDEGRLEIAVLADPAFGDLVMSNAYVGDAELFRGWAATLQRLPASAVEAAGLSKFYDDDSRLILLGPDATQRNFFRADVRNAKVIHIATHGYFNESVPELIGFAMAKDSETDDGFVSMAEISAQEFSADLVVISACNTGRGFEIAGEGNMSLSRTFLAQGVDSVVATLWPISDSATAYFMHEFYRALNEDGASLAESLRSAQHSLQEDRRYRDPFYWGGFVLTSAVNPASAH